MAAAFNNPNPIVHPPASLLNTGRIEYSNGDFYMYNEGITESVALAIRAVYDESCEVAKALGFEMLEYRDIDFRTKTSIMGVSSKRHSTLSGSLVQLKARHLCRPDT